MLCPSPHRAFVLLLTLLLLVLLATTAAQLATLSSTQVLGVGRRSSTLQHSLAVDSAIALIANRLTIDSPLEHQIDHDKLAVVSFNLQACEITVAVRDDGAKFNLLPMIKTASSPVLLRKVEELGRIMRLPRLEIQLRPVLIDRDPTPRETTHLRTSVALLSFDQLFPAAPPPLVFHWNFDEIEHRPHAVWSDYISIWGDGRIDLKRSDPKVVKLALSDLQSDLVQTSGSETILTELLANADAQIRPQIAARIGYGLGRYALSIRTRIGGDIRRWYVVATLRNGTAVILHRQQVSW